MTMTRDDRMSLDAEARGWLVALDRAPLAWGLRRPAPPGLLALLAAGLAFRSHSLITITERGTEVREHVA